MSTVPDNRLNAAIRTVFGRTSRATGQQFFESIALELAAVLRADHTMIAEVVDDSSTQVRTLALCSHGEIADGITYDLAGTPCANVVAGTVCHYACNVAEQFPEDELLAEMGIEGYAGVPLMDQKGRPLGILVALFESPAHDDGFSSSVMLVFASRVASEMERVALEKERRELERSMLHAQKLESLGLLAGGIAHDFNNLLCGVLGAADLVSTELGPRSPVSQEIEMIRQSAVRATDLCSQLLAYSGKGRFVIKPLDLSDLVHDMSRLFEISVSKNVQVRYRLAPSLPRVAGDATQLRQVVLNLVINASEAIDDEGLITVRTGKTTFAEQGMDPPRLGALVEDLVFLEIADDGRGMSAETVAHVFDPFFTTKSTGRGLGLAAVHGIVRGHGGRTVIESEPGAGTVFRVLLPIAEEEAADAAPAAGGRAEESGWRSRGLVLLIEDDVHVQLVCRRMLESFGLDVVVEGGGAGGVDRFREHREDIRLVVVDLTMPQMSGEETFFAIRRIDPEARILVTSGASHRDATKLLESKGPTDFLKKPFTIRDLRAHVRALLERS